MVILDILYKLLEMRLFQYKKNVKIKKKEYTDALNHSCQNGNKLYEVLIIAE